ncbi:MAG: DUF4276 family protein [Verrucomicrobiaceae bacterium]|nr:MAG: DUF4276 family protein [Verrucomicrobiaceae bacterium]
MPSLAIVVEGYGDVAAVPAILGRVGNAFGVNAYAANPPIRVKGLAQLVRPGELERWVKLAQSRDGVDRVLFVIDVDEGCPVSLRSDFETRIQQMGNAVTKPVSFCLIKAEFETWFLADAENLKLALPEYGWADNVAVIDPSNRRGAKELLDSLLLGSSYKETRDQEIMARKIDIKSLYASDRSFKRFVKCVTSLDYDDLDFLAT